MPTDVDNYDNSEKDESEVINWKEDTLVPYGFWDKHAILPWEGAD